MPQASQTTSCDAGEVTSSCHFNEWLFAEVTFCVPPWYYAGAPSDLAHMSDAKTGDAAANVLKLRNALRHWQSLEIDYRGLLDEFSNLDHDATRDDLLNAARAFAPETVTDKELEELIEPRKGQVRRPDQIIHLLQKRIDWVITNIDSLRKQIATAQTVTDTSSAQENVLSIEHNADLPVFEITETLDNKGNVLTSSTRSQDTSATTLIDVLEKVKEKTGEEVSKKTDVVPQVAPIEQGEQARTTEVINSDEEVDTDSDIDEETDRYSSLRNPNDTVEEALLRDQMLRYSGLEEIGNIVAELEMNDDESLVEEGDVGREEDDDSYDDEIDDPWSDSGEDDEISDEDEFGRSIPFHNKRKQQQQVQELQSRISGYMANMGSEEELLTQVKDEIHVLRPDEKEEYLASLPPSIRQKLGDTSANRPSAKEAARQAAIAREEAFRMTEESTEMKPKSKSKKSVKFAPELDIAADTRAEGPRRPVTKENVVERTASDPRAPIRSSLAKTRGSKVDSTTNDEVPTFPPPFTAKVKPREELGPTDRTLAETLVERVSPNTTALPPDPDDFDEELQKRQMALEHHQFRNRMIHDQGGYVEEREAVVPSEFANEGSGPPKKISRFKAARLMR